MANKTYNSMDDDMKFKLKNIFDSNSSWSYTNSVINLDDNASVSDIVETLISSKNLSLSSDLQNDIDVFFNFFIMIISNLILIKKNHL